MKKYNHMYALAFSVNTDRDKDDPVSVVEILEAITVRIADVTSNREWGEAIGQPIETILNQPGQVARIIPKHKVRNYEPVDGDEANYLNYYRHCGVEWSDVWSCMCNDRCPECNCEIEPYESKDLTDGTD